MAHALATLAILAGGKGRRLGGAAKGTLRIGGQRLDQRLLELGGRFHETLWIGADDAPVGARLVPDVFHGRGAPSGLHAALAAARTPWIVLLACDMPFVRMEVLTELLNRAEDGLDFVCAGREERIEPMPGVYARSFAPAVAAALPFNPSFQQIFMRARGRVLQIDEFRRLDPELSSWVSINTPQDVERWGVELPSGNG